MKNKVSKIFVLQGYHYNPPIYSNIHDANFLMYHPVLYSYMIICLCISSEDLFRSFYYLFFQAQNLQIDFLTKILPNYHYMKKPTKSQSPQKQ